MGCFPMSRAAAAAASVALGLLAARAEAATWLVSYTANSGAPAVADLTVETADALNAAGGYDVTGISGAVDGDAVTGLIANPNQPAWSYSADGWFMFDNNVYAAAPNVSWYGLFFSGASGDEYNLFSDNPSTYELYRARAGVGFVANSVGSLAVAPAPVDENSFANLSVAVPEPAGWAMMIIGLGGVGAMLRRRRSQAPTPA
jgi:hypothetical protein